MEAAQQRAERLRRLDRMKQVPEGREIELTPEQEAARAAWVEKLRQHNAEQWQKQCDREGRGGLNDPEEQKQKRQDAERRAAQRKLTVVLPYDQQSPEYKELRARMMCAAGDVLDWQDRTDRGLNEIVFLYEVAGKCGFDIQTEADEDALKSWVRKARDMATEYRRRAAQNDGQYLIW